MFQKGGVFGLLEEECAIRGSDNNRLLDKLNKHLGETKKFPKFKKKQLKDTFDFSIDHYAGKVSVCLL